MLLIIKTCTENRRMSKKDISKLFNGKSRVKPHQLWYDARFKERFKKIRRALGYITDEI